MRNRRQRQLLIVGAIVVLSTVFGAAQAPHGLTSRIGGGITGALIGLIITTLEILARDVYARPLRRIPRPILFIIRTLTYGATFIAIPYVTLIAIHLVNPNVTLNDLLGSRNLLLYFGFSFLVNFFMALRRMMGLKTLWALAIGRYHRPQEEERIVCFMDLRGSTHLAEQMGTARYHDFLNDVFFDVADPIMRSGATVYQYVGDEIVVTWTAERGLKNGVCLTLPFGIEDALANRRDAYLKDYGAEPSLRGALHIGPLMVGEIGDLNRQIVMIGDTMNTTSRIEGACRKFNRDYIVSGPLLARIGQLPPGIESESLGPVPLAGKSGELELFALSRA